MKLGLMKETTEGVGEVEEVEAGAEAVEEAISMTGRVVDQEIPAGEVVAA